MGDWDDLVPDGEPEPEVRLYVPADVDWFDFLVHMGWADEGLLNRQSVLWVEQQWQIFLYQLQTGRLSKGLF